LFLLECIEPDFSGPAKNCILSLRFNHKRGSLSRALGLKL
jgi:hypothetical protein